MALMNWATQRATMIITMGGKNVNLKQILKNNLSSNCILLTRIHEVGIASNRKSSMLR